MARARYWKLTADEMTKIKYDESKLLNWDIKCIREPEEDAKFVGVFMYRNGTPYNYEAIKGLAYYHNHIPLDELPKITKFLKNKFGGEELTKGDRRIIKDSKEIYSGHDIGTLAKELEEFLKATAVITLEFTDFDEEEMTKSGLPASKLLPIPTK